MLFLAVLSDLWHELALFLSNRLANFPMLLIVEKLLSKVTWNWGDTCLVVECNTNWIVEACTNYGPKKQPILALVSHSGILFPACKLALRAYIGQPKGWKLSSLGLTFVLENFSM